MTDICIIGGGTAGLTAAIYGLRAGKSVKLIEELTYGGQIINSNSIENYPGFKNISGYEFSTALYEQALEQGLDFIADTCIELVKAEDKFTISCKENTIEAKTVIIATGVKRRKLNVPGEERLAGNGVSYCATCDGAFFKGRDVAICGGGNTALDEAIFLSNYCSKVILIHRREEFRGSSNKLSLLEARNNVEIIKNSTILCVNGTEEVSSITYRDNITGKSVEKPVSGVFVAIGQAPDNSFAAKIVNLDESGYVIANEDCKTNVFGLFTAGDCRTKEIRQLTTATADGTVAALQACKYIDM